MNPDEIVAAFASHPGAWSWYRVPPDSSFVEWADPRGRVRVDRGIDPLLAALDSAENDMMG